MATKKKLLQAAAGSAGGAGLNVEEVFSTYLYDGTGTTKTISNGIDLSTEGGMTWFKRRNGAGDNQLFDSERTGRYRLESNTTDAQADEGAVVWSTRTDGFSIGGDGGAQIYNSSSDTYASWTFRKAPKFFDVVTFSTTTGSSTPITVNHNLGSVPGMIIVKTTSTAGDWFVFHRSLGSTKYLDLGSTDQAQTGGTSKWASAPTDTSFTLGGDFVQNATYVAYLFAHNDGDGEFGPDGDADIIKCGSFTSDGSDTVTLGFEPQWVLIKRSDGSSGWYMWDTMRGWEVGDVGDNNDPYIYANSSGAETGFTVDVGYPTATGFETVSFGSGNYIYIAIRRGPMAVPEDATDVFAIDQGDGSSVPAFTAGFPVDMAFKRAYHDTDNWRISSRLIQGINHYTNLTNADDIDANFAFDYQDSYYDDTQSSNNYAWMWKRAPNFFDVVAYTGNGTAGRTVSHNLGVTPEMIWFKKRSSSQNWYVYHKDNTYISGALNSYLRLNTTDANINSSYFMSSISSSNFGLTIGSPNDSGATYIAYLFATLDGVSKVGSYVGDGTNGRVIDCGFSSGARFILAKMASSAGRWDVFDTERGIIASNDPRLSLNNSDAQESPADYVDPHSSGFIVNSPLNDSGVTWIFYAIA